MFRKFTFIALLLLLWTSACSTFQVFSLTPTPTQYIFPTATRTDVPALTVEMLQNAEYTLPGFGDATFSYPLKDGKYSEGDPSVEGYVNLSLLDIFAFGDLNSDGANDAAVLVAANYGGTGVFVSLNAVLNENGQPRHAAWTMLDDRPKVNLLDIRNGEIYIEAIVHAPDDPACCPEQSVTRSYVINGTSLMMVYASLHLVSGAERVITMDVPLDGIAPHGEMEINGSVTILPFENTLTLRVYNEQGNEVFISPIQVTGTGEGGGTFSTTIDMNKFPVGRLRIVVADLSPTDGSVLALDSVEVVTEY